MQWVRDLILQKMASPATSHNNREGRPWLDDLRQSDPGLGLARDQEPKIRVTDGKTEITPEASGIKPRNKQLGGGPSSVDPVPVGDQQLQKRAYSSQGEDGVEWTNKPVRYTSDYADPPWDAYDQEVTPSEKDMTKYYAAAFALMAKDPKYKYTISGMFPRKPTFFNKDPYKFEDRELNADSSPEQISELYEGMGDIGRKEVAQKVAATSQQEWPGAVDYIDTPAADWDDTMPEEEQNRRYRAAKEQLVQNIIAKGYSIDGPTEGPQENISDGNIRLTREGKPYYWEHEGGVVLPYTGSEDGWRQYHQSGAGLNKKASAIRILQKAADIEVEEDLDEVEPDTEGIVNIIGTDSEGDPVQAGTDGMPKKASKNSTRMETLCKHSAMKHLMDSMDKHGGILWKDLEEPVGVATAMSNPGDLSKAKIRIERTKEPRSLTRLFSNPTEDYRNAYPEVMGAADLAERQPELFGMAFNEDPKAKDLNDLLMAKYLLEKYPGRYRNASKKTLSNSAKALKEFQRTKIDKEAFFGLGKKRPMLKRPKRMGRGAGRRAQQMSNIENEYKGKGAFHPNGPVMQNRGSIGSGSTAVASGQQAMQDWRDTGHNPDITMQYRKGGQMQGTYPSLSGETTSYPAVASAPAAAPSAPSNAAPAVNGKPLRRPQRFGPAGGKQKPAYAQQAQADAAKGVSLADQAMNSRNNFIRTTRAIAPTTTPKQRAQYLTPADKHLSSATPQQRADAYHQADTGMQATSSLLSAGYNLTTANRIMAQTDKKFGRAPSAAKLAMYNKIIAYAKKNPTRGGKKNPRGVTV